MIYWITSYYLKPNSTLFKFFSILNRHFSLILAALFFLIVLPTLAYWLHTLNLVKNSQEEIQNIAKEYQQKQTLYQAMRQHQNMQENKSNQLAQLSQQVENILKQYRTPIESLQWHTEENKQLTLIATQKSQIIFNVIKALNEFETLRPQTIVLTKQPEEKQLQLHTTLILVNTGNTTNKEAK